MYDSRYRERMVDMELEILVLQNVLNLYWRVLCFQVGAASVFCFVYSHSTGAVMLCKGRAFK